MMDKLDYEFGFVPTAGGPSGLSVGVRKNDGNAKAVGY